MQNEITLKEIQLILSAFRNLRLLFGGMGDWSKIDRLEKKLIRNARLLTKRAPDARKSALKSRSKNKKGSAKPARG